MTSKVVHVEGECYISVRGDEMEGLSPAGAVIFGLAYLLISMMISLWHPPNGGFDQVLITLIIAFLAELCLLLMLTIPFGKYLNKMCLTTTPIYRIYVDAGVASGREEVIVKQTDDEQADHEAICKEVRKLIPVAKKHAAEIEHFNRVANCNKPVKED